MMQAKPEYRRRDETEVAVLDALADRNGEGMTVFELRAKVEVDIDTLETALADLKADGLIEVTEEERETLITVAERVVGPEPAAQDDDIFEELRRRFPF